MGEASILGLLPRGTGAGGRGRDHATDETLARLGTADAAIADFEREERALIEQLEQQRSRIALLTMQIQRDAARSARRSPEDVHEALRHVVDLESTLQSRVRAFEGTLTQLHARLVEWRRRRDVQRREREALIRALEAPVRAAYERAVRRGRTPAIALLRDGECSACHAPVTWPEALKDAVFSCWQCQRLLTGPA
jgi:predicted  nucleic acid-binding Zn-ribbon protein